MTLYRTYRPQRFSDLIGQDTARSILIGALKKKRITHAYLFTGPRGIGKTSAARIFAKALCCLAPLTTGPDYEPCLKCANCIAIAQGQTTDFYEIDAASNRSIEDVRNLREQAQYPPIQLQYRIYIIDECHMLSHEAFNALLKTLEEPPAHCLFILATTELHKVPLTIKSRCQLIRFDRGSVAAITTKLDQIVQHSKLKVEAGVTELIAQSADGAFRDAEGLLEQLSANHDNLTVAKILVSLGTVPIESCRNLLEAVLDQDMTQTKELLDRHFSDESLRFSWIFSQIISLLQERLSGTPLEVYALAQFLESSILQKQSPINSLPLALACYNIVNFARTENIPRPSKNILPFADKPLPEEKRNQPDPPKNTGSENTSMDKVTVKTVSQNAPVEVPVIELRTNLEPLPDIRKAWKKMTEEIALESLPLAHLLRELTFHSAENNTITLYVRFKFHLEKLHEKKNQTKVQTVLEQLTGQKWKLDYQLNQNLAETAKRPQIPGKLNQTDVNAVFQ